MHDAFDAPLSRRQLLVHTGAALAGSALLAGTRASARADERPKIILGSGEHRYECLHDWLTPPADIKWGDTQGIAQDSKGRLYVFQNTRPDSTKKDAVTVFDRSGKFVGSWGPQFAAGAHGIQIRKEGANEFCYLCDTAKRTFTKTDLNGNVIWEKGVPQEPGVYKEGVPFVPTNVAFGQDNDFYLVDGYGSSYVHHYDAKGNWKRTFGGPGTEPGKFKCCHGAWLDTRRKHEPALAITDRESNRMQHISLDGKPISIDMEGQRRPCNYRIHGDLMVVPDLNSVVTLLDRDNAVVATLGDGHPSDLRGKPREQFIPGKFIHPHDAIFLPNGDIVIAEWVPVGRVTLLKKVR